VPYADSATARRAFEHVVANLDREIRPIERTASRLVFRDYSGAYGEVLLDGARIVLKLGLAREP
jgi:hypothetical protein